MSKSVKTFNKEFTSKIAELARLNLSEAEISYFSGQFNSTLEVIDKLKNIDTKDTSEAYNITGLKNVFREDLVDEKRIFTQEEALSNAPRTHNGFFVVKGIFDEQ